MSAFGAAARYGAGAAFLGRQTAGRDIGKGSLFFLHAVQTPGRRLYLRESSIAALVL